MALGIRPTNFQFRLTDLPMELQLKVLEFCLTRPEPLLNFLRGPFSTFSRGYCMHNCNDHSCNIIYANRQYLEEGRRVLASKHKLLYTGSDGAATYIPDGVLEQPWSSHIKNLGIVHRGANAASASNTISNICYAAKRLPNLHFIDIDFVDPFGWTHGISGVLDLCSMPASTKKSVRKLTMTGLEMSKFAWWMIQLSVIHLLAPCGTIGVGFGPEGRRYNQIAEYDMNNGRFIWLPRTTIWPKIHWMAYSEAYEGADAGQAASRLELANWLKTIEDRKERI